jgi:hypothetical protein
MGLPNENIVILWSLALLSSLIPLFLYIIGTIFSKVWCSLLTGFLLPHLLIFLFSPFYPTETPTILSFEFLDVFVIFGFVHTTLTNSNFVLYLVLSWAIANTKKDTNVYISQPTKSTLTVMFISMRIHFLLPFTVTSPLSSIYH